MKGVKTMKKYLVRITETLEREIEVEAKTPEEAKERVHNDYRCEDIILDSGDCIGADFAVFNEKGEEIIA